MKHSLLTGMSIQSYRMLARQQAASELFETVTRQHSLLYISLLSLALLSTACAGNKKEIIGRSGFHVVTSAESSPVGLCPADVDNDGVSGDGVPGCKDKCPGTHAGKAVDSDGCPVIAEVKQETPQPTETAKLSSTADRARMKSSATANTSKTVTSPSPAVPSVVVDSSSDKTTLRFVEKDSSIDKESVAKLNQVVEKLRQNPNLHVKVAGYTDTLGSEKNNLKLSSKRANQVAKYIQKQGIASHRIKALGHGEARPIASNKTEEGRKQNRRVEVSVLSAS